MPCFFWCAFDTLSISPQRLAQIQFFAQWFNARPLLICTHESALPSAWPFAAQKLPPLGDDRHNPAALAQALSELATSLAPDFILGQHSPALMRILSLLAAARSIPYIQNLRTDSFPTWTRDLCAGRLIESFDAPPLPFCATLALSPCPISLPPAPLLAKSPVLAHPSTPAPIFIPHLASFQPFDQDLRLDGARLVFAAGRGIGSPQNFQKLTECARRYGAGLAASRPVVDMGWCRNDRQVGQTGHSIAPQIYVAFGISGAVQHLAGIRNAQKIFAVNIDKNAPIFAYADVGLVADASSVIDSLLHAS